MKILKTVFSKNNNKIELIEGENLQSKDCEFSPSQSPKSVLIIGVVHGDEPQGKFLIEKYFEKIQNVPCTFKNRMLFIPCLNPDGMALNTRQNANKIDLNRNFPTSNWEVSDNPDYYGGEVPASEVETKFLIEILEEHKPDAILTLHSPYKVVNYDGPAKIIAERISAIIDYPTSTDIGYPTPGSFGTYAGVERNIPTITLELDEEVPAEDLVNPVHFIFDYLSIFN